MTYEMKMREFRQDGYEEGFETGFESGFESGESKGRIQSARNFIACGLLSFDDIKATGIYSKEEPPLSHNLLRSMPLEGDSQNPQTILYHIQHHFDIAFHRPQ